MRTETLDLRNVTLCAIDCLNPLLAARALDVCKSHCRFGDTILLTDKSIDSNSRLALIPALDSKEAYSAFVLKELVKYIGTPWVLLVQWDGYIVNPSMWTEDFFDYDYIGARWPFFQDGMTVGNGGFSLRSTRLMRILASDERFGPRAGLAEDTLICRHFRPTLEAEYGLRFAPDHLADRFSVELTDITELTFGFHGQFNMHRLAHDDELRHIAKHAHPRTVGTGEFVGLWFRCLEDGRTPIADLLYARLREIVPAHDIEGCLRSSTIDPSDAAARVAFCESRLNLQQATQ
jgi:hypothetical protein